ncbi:hypothetical protein ANRL3_01631 [Anaerolineae bacterium]|nr:hypothetical protein ANRL3_01631 [Anaerolineae bacterium]
MSNTTVLTRKLTFTDLQYQQFNVSGPWRAYFPEADQPFTVELDTGIVFKTSVDSTNPRLRGERDTATDWYQQHRLKQGDSIYLEVLEPGRRYRLSAHLPKGTDAASALPPMKSETAPKPTRVAPTHTISAKTEAVSADDGRPVLSKTLTLTDRNYNLLSIARELKEYFPEPGVPFSILFDTDEELETTRDSLGRVREGFGQLRNWYDHHQLAVGDTIYIEVLKLNQRYRLSVELPTGTALTAEYKPAARPRRTSNEPAHSLPEIKPKRSRGRPLKNQMSEKSNDGRYALFDQEIRSIHDYLDGRTGHRPSNEQLCDWVQFCYRFELYQEGHELFALVNSVEVNAWYFDRTKKLATICKMKAG